MLATGQVRFEPEFSKLVFKPEQPEIFCEVQVDLRVFRRLA